MAIQVVRTGTNWTVDVTALGLVTDTLEKDFIVTIGNVEQPLVPYNKTTATVITYSGVALPANTAVTLYRYGLRDIQQFEFGETTSQLSVNARMTQIERVLDDIREVKKFLWTPETSGSDAVTAHVALADPHTQYRLKSAAVPAAEVSGVLADSQVPASVVRTTQLTAHEAAADPHPVYTTAGELATALTPYQLSAQRGAASGYAPLGADSKVPATNSRGASASFAAATGVWSFTWPDGSTQNIDTPAELVFQSVNFDPGTQIVTFTLVGGATTTMSLATLVDLPEISLGVGAPVASPTTGQRIYIRTSNGDMYYAVGTNWVGPNFHLTTIERNNLAALGNLAFKTFITSADITDGSISDADIAVNADISQSKVAGLTAALAALQPLDSDLSALAALVTTGVVERTGPGTAATIAVGATGKLSIGAADEAAGRAAIDAAISIYPNATLTPTLPATATEGQINISGDVAYEWGFGGWRAKDDLRLTPLQRINAARGLIYNGGCTLAPLTNPATPSVRRVPGCSGIYRQPQGGAGWRDIFADESDKLFGRYSLSISGRNIVGYEDPFPVIAGIIYGCWGAIKQSTPGANTWYQMILPLDDDGNTITPPTYQYVAASRSRLAVALTSGDTQIQIQRFRDAPGTSAPVVSWVPAIGYANLGTFGIFNWVSAGGFVYPTWENESAQRPAYTQRLIDWVTPVTISGDNYVITLNAAYSGPTIPIGTPVANMVDGSTFVYPNSGSYNADTSWLSIRPNVAANAGQSGLFAVRGSYGSNAAILPLPPWTARVIPGMLVGYGANSNTVTDWHYDIYPLPL